MYIDSELCQPCMSCRPVCPVGAIAVKHKKVVIKYEACVECGVCRRLKICPEGAIMQVDEIPYPRIIRAAFSDPTHRHTTTEVLGRGTEEMKTNDVKMNSHLMSLKGSNRNVFTVEHMHFLWGGHDQAQKFT